MSTGQAIAPIYKDELFDDSDENGRIIQICNSIKDQSRQRCEKWKKIETVSWCALCFMRKIDYWLA